MEDTSVQETCLKAVIIFAVLFSDAEVAHIHFNEENSVDKTDQTSILAIALKSGIRKEMYCSCLFACGLLIPMFRVTSAIEDEHERKL